MRHLALITKTDSQVASHVGRGLFKLHKLARERCCGLRPFVFDFIIFSICAFAFYNFYPLGIFSTLAYFGFLYAVGLPKNFDKRASWKMKKTHSESFYQGKKFTK